MKDSKKFWNKQAKNFDSNDNSESKDLFEQSKEYLDSGMTVLDFACGTGGSTALLANHVDKVLALDYSEEMIFYAKKHESRKKNITFKVASIFDDELSQEKFDVITAYNVCHLLDDLDHVLHRMSTLLKDKGVIISNTAVLGEKKNVLSSIIKLLGKTPFFPSINSLSVNQLEEKFRNQGFTILKSNLSNNHVPNCFLVVKKSN